MNFWEYTRGWKIACIVYGVVMSFAMGFILASMFWSAKIQQMLRTDQQIRANYEKAAAMYQADIAFLKERVADLADKLNQKTPNCATNGYLTMCIEQDTKGDQ